VRQQVISTIGRLDQLQEKGRVETLIVGFLFKRTFIV